MIFVYFDMFSIILIIDMSVPNSESKYANESSCVESLNRLGISFEVPKLTKLHTIEVDYETEVDLCNIRIDLYKSDVKNVLFRIEARDDSERKWVLDLKIENLDGQSCQPIIRQFPTLFERLFQQECCSVCNGEELRSTDSNMELEFTGDIMSVKLTLGRIVESEAETTAKTIRKQSATIANLQEENKNLMERLEKLEKLCAGLKKSSHPPKYIDFNGLDREKLEKLLWDKDPEFKKYVSNQHNTTRKECFNKFCQSQGRSDQVWWLSVMYSEGWELVDCEFQTGTPHPINCRFNKVVPKAYRKYFIDSSIKSDSTLLVKHLTNGITYIISYIDVKVPIEKPKAAEKIIAMENFSVNDNRKPYWKHKLIKDSDNGDMSIFIDVTSGLVVYNEEDIEAKTLEQDRTEGLIAYGVWNNKNQEVEELSRTAKRYAKKLKLAEYH